MDKQYFAAFIKPSYLFHQGYVDTISFPTVLVLFQISETWNGLPRFEPYSFELVLLCAHDKWAIISYGSDNPWGSVMGVCIHLAFTYKLCGVGITFSLDSGCIRIKNFWRDTNAKKGVVTSYVGYGTGISVDGSR